MQDEGMQRLGRGGAEARHTGRRDAGAGHGWRNQDAGINANN